MDMKLGGFFCTCAKTSTINYKKVRKALKGRFEVFIIQDLLCTNEGLAYIVDYTRGDLIDIALIGCTEKLKVFEKIGEKLSIPFYYLNLREHCGWVHRKKEATEKGIGLIASKIKEIETYEEILPLRLDVGEVVLFIGNLPEVFKVAHELAGVASVKVLAEDLTKASIHGSDVDVVLGRVKHINGEIGNFTVLVEPNLISYEKCISCGKCSIVCPKGAISHKHYFISGECDTCGRCIDACPANAISFDRGLEKIQAGQIITVNSEDTGRMGIYTVYGDVSSLEGAALKAALNLGKMVKPMAIEVNLENCAAGKSRVVGCRLCESACPHGAIVRNGDKISYSQRSCNGCGACAAVCPVSIPKYTLKPVELIHEEMEALLERDFDKKVLLFTCERMGELLSTLGKERMEYPPVLPLFLPCLNGLSELEILRVFDLGADGVILLGCKCPHGSAYTSLVDFSVNILEFFNLDERVLSIQSPDPMEFSARVEKFIDSLPHSRIQKGGSLSFKNKREDIIELLRRFSRSLDTVPDGTLEKEIPFALLEVDSSKCTLCNTCSIMCPQEALHKDGNTLTFSHSLCIACELCEKSCPEKAITLRKTLDFKRLLEGRVEVVSQGEVLTCPSCGKVTVSKNALQTINSRLGENKRVDMEALRYCPDCRALKALGFIGSGDDR